MKILLVSSFLPFPLHSGGHIRLYNLLKLLSQKHDITLICEKRPHQTEADKKAVEEVCKKVITVNRKKQWTLAHILRAGFSTQPFLLVGHNLPDMKQAISKELRTSQYDLIHVETFYVYQNLPQTDLPVLLIEHNIEYKVYERYMDTAPFFLKPFLKLDSAKIKRAEEKSWNSATKVATVSADDKKVVGRADTEVIANGVDLHEFTFKNNGQKTTNKGQKILYIGDYKWIQNTDAAKYIITKIWPEIKRKLHSENMPFDVKLWIVGRSMPESLKALGKGDRSIIFDDKNTQTTPDIFRDADVLLAPKRVGGGTSYKIIEAMAVGTPVVTTSLGLEGLDIKANEDVLVSDTPEQLANQVVSLITDPVKARRLAENGRIKIEKTYDWRIIAATLERLYASLIHTS